jgi:hypothetical protein
MGFLRAASISASHGLVGRVVAAGEDAAGHVAQRLGRERGDHPRRRVAHQRQQRPELGGRLGGVGHVELPRVGHLCRPAWPGRVAVDRVAEVVLVQADRLGAVLGELDDVEPLVRRRAALVFFFFGSSHDGPIGMVPSAWTKSSGPCRSGWACVVSLRINSESRL